jgi:hypothetical protein
MHENGSDVITAGVDKFDSLDPSVWLLEEYKLLSGHYFHEDNQYWKTISIFGVLNSGLLAFLGSTFVDTNAVGRLLIPIVGVALCLAWLAALIRLREWRGYIEGRIEKIEIFLNDKWKLSTILPLDLRRAEDWLAHTPPKRLANLPNRILRNLPSTITLMALPLLFACVWISSIIFYLFSAARWS